MQYKRLAKKKSKKGYHVKYTNKEQATHDQVKSN